MALCWKTGGPGMPQLEIQCPGVWLISGKRAEQEIDQWIGSAVMQILYQPVVVKRELSVKAKLWINMSTLSCRQ